MTRAAPSMSLGNAVLDDTRHICAFFTNDDEEYRVLLPFIKEGFERGDKAIHVVSPDQSLDHRQRLVRAGIDTTGAEERGQWRDHDDAVICTYRLDQFRGDAVIDILRTHPAVIVGGILQRNPFFVPPEQFVPEFRDRLATQRHSRGTV